MTMHQEVPFLWGLSQASEGCECNMSALFNALGQLSGAIFHNMLKPRARKITKTTTRIACRSVDLPLSHWLKARKAAHTPKQANRRIVPLDHGVGVHKEPH